MCELPIWGENTDEPQDSLFWIHAREKKRSRWRQKWFSRQLLPLSFSTVSFLFFSSLTHRLLSRGVVIVELAAQQCKPLSQIEHTIVHEITRSGFDHEDSLVREVLGQTGGNDTPCCATTDDYVVIAVTVRRSNVRGRHRDMMRE